jgi:hypothetical protein
MSAAAEDHSLRFRTYYWGCKFLSCAYRKVRDDKLNAGSWRYSSYYGSTKNESRRVRVDAWNSSEKSTAVGHMGMTYWEPCTISTCF